MGLMPPPKLCHITDLPTQDRPSEVDAVDYFVNFNNEQQFFRFRFNHQNSEFVSKNKHILKGLIANDKFPDRKEYKILDNEKLTRIINEAQVPKTPKNILDNLLLFLFSIQGNSGSIIDIKGQGDWETTLCKLYFKNHNEYWFYLNTLKEQGLITFLDISSLDGSDGDEIQITYQGLEYLISLEDSGENSKLCFIAMSFSETALPIRESIKKVVLDCGYEPCLVDEAHFESDLTINDAIIRFIRKSKFIIADFSEQKHGVYFESGFALGLGRPVIYSCSKQYFNETHFDTNHYPHIVYSELSDLEYKLKDKILAWID